MRTFFQIILGFIGIVILAAVVGFVALNLYIHSTYNDFYQKASREFSIPGINDGFIPQDLDFMYDDDLWLISGYMNDNTASPIYRYDQRTGKSVEFFVDLKDGTAYRGHGSAITSDNDYVYLTCEGGYLVLDYALVLQAHEGEHIIAAGEVKLDITPSFMNISGDTMYAGEFYYPGEYETPQSHHLTSPAGASNPALMFAYARDDKAMFGFSDQPEAAYSIPDMVQGMTVIYDHTFVLSQSWGLNPSHIRCYDMSSTESNGTFTLDDGKDVPLYYLDTSNQVSTLEVPPMLEGIDSIDNMVYTTDESASNKYIFGKLYGAGNVYSLDMPQMSKSSGTKADSEQ